VLAAAIEAEAGTGAFPVIAAGPFAVVLADPAFARAPRLPLPGLEAALSTARLARLLGMGPHHSRLPSGEADRAVFEAADLPGLAARVARAELTSPPAGADQEVLRELAGACTRLRRGAG
jgi:hypothetical protein